MATLFSFLCCKQKMEMGNFRVSAETINGKWEFVSLGQQTVNGNRRLLFPQMCPSMRLTFII
jgi:hypothetical protein